MEGNTKTRRGPKKSGLLLIKERFHHQTPASAPPLSSSAPGSSRRCYSLREATEAKSAEVRLQTSSPSPSPLASFSAASPASRRLNNHVEHDHGFAAQG